MVQSQLTRRHPSCEVAFGLFGILFFVVLALLVGGVAYSWGLSAGQTAVVGARHRRLSASGYWHPFWFGIFGFLFFFLLHRALLLAAFRPRRWAAGPVAGVRRRGPGAGAVRGGAQGGPERPGDREWLDRDVPPAFRPMLESWHRQAHGEPPTTGPPARRAGSPGATTGTTARCTAARALNARSPSNRGRPARRPRFRRFRLSGLRRIKPMSTILVVDDEPRIVQLARDYLEHAGFDVLDRRRRTDGARAARTRSPDLIVLDLGLPRTRRPGRGPRRAPRLGRADHHADRPRGRDRQARRPRAGRRRLPDQAVQPAGARGAGPRRPATRRTATLRTPTSCGSATWSWTCRGCACRWPAGASSSPRPSSSCSSRSPDSRGASSPVGSCSTRSTAIAFESFERAIDAHVKNIRRKIEPDPRSPRYVQTVFGVGYRFAEPE